MANQSLRKSRQNQNKSRPNHDFPLSKLVLTVVNTESRMHMRVCSKGHPMPTEILSRRIAALEACRVLHLAGELDKYLQPIGKESFHLLFSAEDIMLDEADRLQAADINDPRPGTNKRRQCYQRKVLMFGLQWKW